MALHPEGWRTMMALNLIGLWPISLDHGRDSGADRENIFEYPCAGGPTWCIYHGALASGPACFVHGAIQDEKRQKPFLISDRQRKVLSIAETIQFTPSCVLLIF